MATIKKEYEELGDLGLVAQGRRLSSLPPLQFTTI